MLGTCGTATVGFTDGMSTRRRGEWLGRRRPQRRNCCRCRCSSWRRGSECGWANTSRARRRLRTRTDGCNDASGWVACSTTITAMRLERGAILFRDRTGRCCRRGEGAFMTASFARDAWERHGIHSTSPAMSLGSKRSAASAMLRTASPMGVLSLMNRTPGNCCPRRPISAATARKS